MADQYKELNLKTIQNGKEYIIHPKTTANVVSYDKPVVVNDVHTTEKIDIQTMLDDVNDYIDTNTNNITSINENLKTLNDVVGVAYDGQDLSNEEASNTLSSKTEVVYNMIEDIEKVSNDMNNQLTNLNTIFVAEDNYDTIFDGEDNNFSTNFSDVTLNDGYMVLYNIEVTSTSTDENTNVTTTITTNNIYAVKGSLVNTKYVCIPIVAGDYFKVKCQLARDMYSYLIVKAKLNDGEPVIPDRYSNESNPPLVIKTGVQEKRYSGVKTHNSEINITKEDVSDVLQEDEGYFLIINTSYYRVLEIQKRNGVNYSINKDFTETIRYNKLNGKKVACFGDGFMFNAFHTANMREKFLTKYNLIMNDYSITDNYNPKFTYSSSDTSVNKDNNLTLRIMNKAPGLTNSSTHTDYIILQGCKRDIETGTSHESTIVENTAYKSDLGELDTTKFEEALEKSILTIKNNNPTTKIGFIIPPKYPLSNGYNLQYAYFNIIRTLCKRHAISILDLADNGIIDANLSAYNSVEAGYYITSTNNQNVTDGIHFTELGYDTFILDRIVDWLLTL